MNRRKVGTKESDEFAPVRRGVVCNILIITDAAIGQHADPQVDQIALVGRPSRCQTFRRAA